MRSLSFWRVSRAHCTFCGVTQLQSSFSDIGVKTSETWLRLSSGSTASFHSTGSFGLSGKWSCILLNASLSIVLKPELFVTVMGGVFSHPACLISLSYKLKEKMKKKTSVRKPWIRKFIGIQLLVRALFLFSFGNMLLMLGFITKELIQICGFPRLTVKTFSRNGFFLSMYTIKTHHFNGDRRRHWRTLQPTQTILDPVQPLANPSVHWLNFVDHLKSSKR